MTPFVSEFHTKSMPESEIRYLYKQSLLTGEVCVAVKMRMWTTSSELTNSPRITKEQFQAQLVKYRPAFRLLREGADAVQASGPGRACYHASRFPLRRMTMYSSSFVVNSVAWL